MCIITMLSGVELQGVVSWPQLRVAISRNKLVILEFVDIMNESTDQSKLDSIAIGRYFGPVITKLKCFLFQKQLQVRAICTTTEVG